MAAKSNSRKADDRRSLRLWIESVAYWEGQAKFWFNARRTWTLTPDNPEAYWAGNAKGNGWLWSDAPSPEAGYAFCRRAFNLARRQVKVTRRRIARSAASYLKNYKGK
jgi:hypothetical protein